MVTLSKKRQSRAKPTGKGTTPQIDVVPHLAWAKSLAKRVSRQYRFGRGSQEEQEIVSAAHLVLCEKAHTYEPKLEVTPTECGALFRGYCQIAIVTDCRRECRRLLNGGTYNTRNETPGVTLMVDQLPTITEDGHGWELVDYRKSYEDSCAAH